MTPPPFEEIISQNKEKIYRICRIYARVPLEPQDLFQEVVFQAWKSFQTFKGDSNVSTWIYRVALNVCLSAQLKYERGGEQSIRLDSIQIVDEKEVKDERFEMLKACISNLDDADKSIVILYLDELAYKEIASIMGLTENHIAVKMKRIRKKLFDCITQKLG